VGADLGLGELAHRLAQQLLLFTETKIHCCECIGKSAGAQG
jgi:hypothetical protein